MAQENAPGMENGVASEDPFILCDNLVKIYKVADLEVVALQGLDLTVRRGEMLGIVGNSGSGKSSLLNILGGLDRPSAGRVVVNGRDLLKLSEPDLVGYRCLEVGFLWQQPSRNLVPYLTALQNVEFPIVVAGRPGVSATRRAKELLETVGLSHRRTHRPRELSGGEQQRVAIAVALANSPPLLLADEPTGELDSRLAAEIFAVLRRVNEEYGTTVVLVTHDRSVTARVGRVVSIRDGRTSTETIRRESEQEITHDEHVVLDGAGRLQIPKEYLESLGIRDRVKVELDGDHIAIRPPRWGWKERA